ncbi:MAG: 2,3-bisphosphoglycerate-dependent phosphoglycerate mutase [Candidatus Nomurabacteria bacterium]|jgi:2,3-bisphosphoglycerate-dependent phosphoglycerate mutase|nr:2,3-bisphosphoglycerate-dependent phosphoglycerate mutase [Candidatus Nomurabacteria bacterium]
MIGKLILVRHTESTYNAKGLWAGITDVELSDKGRSDARKIGAVLADLKFDRIYLSPLKRTRQTLDEMLKTYGETTAEVRETAAINERDYGDYAGLDKWQMRQKVGEETFQNIRRAWDYPVPNGETLRDTYERAVPWYREIVVPKLLSGQTILLVAHGNSNRALRKYLESISDDDIKNVEMDLTTIHIYTIGEDGLAISDEARQIETEISHLY